MNPFTESNVACAQLNILRAIELLEKHTSCDLPDPRLVGAAYAELLDAKGHLAAAKRVEELEREIGEADTERPNLRLVTP